MNFDQNTCTIIQQPLTNRKRSNDSFHIESSSLAKRSRHTTDARPTMASNQQDVARRSGDPPATTSRIFLMKEHCSSSFAVMNQLRKDNQLLDVRFKIDSHVFSAHRVVLASCSPYLRAMFTCGMRESTQEEIELKDIEPQAMELLIEFAYTGEIEVTTGNVQDLLPAAGILQLRDLKVACCEFLSDHMDVTNCLGIKQFADMHSCPDLVKKSNRFIIRKFSDVVKTDEFLEIPHNVLSELLKNDHLHVESESQVFTAFLRWIDSDLDGRAPFAYDLLDCIRVPLLPKEHWERIFNAHRLFKINRECQAYIRGYLMGLDFTDISVKPRSPIETIYCVGGRNSQKCLSTAERYVPEEDRWEELPCMKQVCLCPSVTAVGGMFTLVVVTLPYFYLILSLLPLSSTLPHIPPSLPPSLGKNSSGSRRIRW